MCNKHYIAARLAGTFVSHQRIRLPNRGCSVEQCGAEHYADGLCNKHWQRIYKRGTLTKRNSDAGAAIAFCEEVLKSNTTECILWPFPLKEGYGFVRPPLPGQKRSPQMKASRYVCIRAHGPAMGLHALHTCHNSRCVNPKHLYFGTNDQNIRDKLEAGRQPRGSAIFGTKLTVEQVRLIKSMDLSPFKSKLAACKAIGPEYGVSPYTIKNILNGTCWKYV